MKTQAQYLVVFILSLSFFNCHKDKPVDVLPPVTTDGLNTIGFTVNGKVWTPFYKCDISSNPCGKLEVKYGLANGGIANSIFMGFSRKTDNKLVSALQIGSKPDYGGSIKYSITTIGDKVDSVNLHYFAEDGFREYIGPVPGSSFIISRLDVEKKIISGTFRFLLVGVSNINDTIDLKDGRFDLKMDACECH